MNILKNKIYKLAILFVLTTGCSNKANLYTISIDVAPKKESGQAWDIMGGSPDIKIIVDKQALHIDPTCRDTYRCKYNFTSTKDEWYIEIYDSDMDSDDLIGKGDCEEGEECNLGLARVEVLD